MCYGVVKSDGDESDSKSFACAIPIDCLSLSFVSGLFTVCAMPNSVTFIFNYYGWYGTETKTTSTMMSIGS